ncbi:MAG: hypothetical protein AB7T63_17265 [Planctomycetota bacterium]
MEAFPEAVARARALAVRRHTVWIAVWAGVMTYLALTMDSGDRTLRRLGPVLGLHGTLILMAILLRGPLSRGRKLGLCVGLSGFLALSQLGGGGITLFAKVNHPWPWTVTVAMGLGGLVALRAMLAVILFRRALARDPASAAETFS